jgi:hypothetical protein
MHQMHISTNEVSSEVLGPKKLEIRKKIVKIVKEPKKTQILCHEIEPNLNKLLEDLITNYKDSVYDEFQHHLILVETEWYITMHCFG